jgi:hypothetical protein
MKHAITSGMLLCTLAASSAFAFDCNYLQIAFVNTLPTACHLVKQELKHGYFDYFTYAPPYIEANSSFNSIILRQSFHGPELELTYECGDNKTITLLNHQDYCFMSPGQVSAQVLQAENMSAKANTTTGSFWGSQPGTIVWGFY